MSAASPAEAVAVVRAKGTGWIEVLGAGIVNKKVLENCGIDSEEYSGLAFGIGIERLAMLKSTVLTISNCYINLI